MRTIRWSLLREVWPRNGRDAACGQEEATSSQGGRGQAVGTTAFSYQRVGFSTFVPMDSTMSVLGPELLLAVLSRYPTNSNGSGIFVATPQLPSGALVSGVEFDWCDTSAASDLQFEVLVLRVHGRDHHGARLGRQLRRPGLRLHDHDPRVALHDQQRRNAVRPQGHRPDARRHDVDLGRGRAVLPPGQPRSRERVFQRRPHHRPGVSVHPSPAGIRHHRGMRRESPVSAPVYCPDGFRDPSADGDLHREGARPPVAVIDRDRSSSRLALGLAATLVLLARVKA